MDSESHGLNADGNSTSSGTTITVSATPRSLPGRQFHYKCPTSGTAPLAVLFTDTSTGGTPSMWNWRFGDGSWFNTTDINQRNQTYIYAVGTWIANSRFRMQTGIQLVRNDDKRKRNTGYQTKMGVFLRSTHLYYRDYNGNGVWDGAVIDRVSTFGITGTPVPGTGTQTGRPRSGIPAIDPPVLP